MSLDFDVISYLKGKGHLLAMSFWLYLFLLLQCPHRGVVAASSSAPVPTIIGTEFESWCMFQQQTKCSNTQRCKWICNELQTLKASSICKRRCEWNCIELHTLKTSSICKRRCELQWAPNPKNLLNLLQTDSSSCESVWVGPVGFCSLAIILDSRMWRVLREKNTHRRNSGEDRSLSNSFICAALHLFKLPLCNSGRRVQLFNKGGKKRFDFLVE